MRAASFLGSVGRVRGVVSARRAVRSLEAGRAAWRAVDDAHAAVCDLADLCVAGTPLPPLDCRPPERADDAVASVMEDVLDRLTDDWVSGQCDSGRPAGDPGAGRFDGGRPPSDRDCGEPDVSETGETAAVGTEDGDAIRVTSYDVSSRTRTVNGDRVVPLDRTGPAAANWYVLCDVLASAGTAVGADCRTLVDRHRIQGNEAVADEWAAVADLLSAVVSFVDYHASLARWVRVPDGETVERATATRSLAERLGAQTTREP